MKTDVAGIIERADRHIRLSISGQTIPPQSLSGRLVLLRWEAQRGQASAAVELTDLRPDLWGRDLDVQRDREQEHAPRCTALVAADGLTVAPAVYGVLTGQSVALGGVNATRDPDPFEVEPAPGEFRRLLAAYALSLDIWDS